MAREDGRMSRRDFVGRVSEVTALGGGLFLLGGAAGADVPGPSHAWSESWRPRSPKRLCDETHRLARRALAGEHGRSMTQATFALDEGAVAGLSGDMRYARACRLVAERAPLRVLPGERIVGAATLLEAPAHSTPVANTGSISHTTIGFDRVLKVGYRGLRRQIEDRLARGGFDPASDEPDRTVAGRRGPAFATSARADYGATARPRPEYDAPPLTVECWARLNSKDGFNVIVLNRDKDSRRHWEIYSFAGTGVFSAYLPGYAPDTVMSDRVITDGEWHYLAMVFEPGRVRLYVDAALAADAAVTPTDGLSEGGGALYFGAYPTHGIGCNGAIEEVRISAGARAIARVPDAAFEADAHTLGLWRPAKLEGSTVLEDVAAGNTAFTQRAGRGGADLLQAMLECLDAAEVWRARHIEELDRRAASTTDDRERDIYLRTRAALAHVPEHPARNFHEAVQSLWFAYGFQRLMGNWSGIGRIDAMLGPYLEDDLAAGAITLDEARELLAHFWIKGCEWIGAFDTRGSGDAQHYQNIILGGVDADGRDLTNEVTYLVLDIVEELHISDFPIAVRVSARTPDRLLRRVAEVQRHGGGIVALYNEDVVIEGLVKFGYPLEEARTFANDGCWEVLIPGRTSFIYSPFDGLALLQDALGIRETSAPAPDYPDFEALYAAFIERVADRVEQHQRMADGWNRGGPPAPLLSILVEDCIERARAYNDRGAHYNVLAPHIGRLANVADSLLAIRRLVYEERAMDLATFIGVLRGDWAGHEELRRRIQSRFAFYGNDDDAADAMVERVFNDYTALVARVKEREGVLRPAGISTFGREIEWRDTGPSPDGHRRGDLLATNFSPTPGADRTGPTAVLASYCKMDFTRCPNGATVELKVLPQTVEGERGVDALVGLMRGFVRMGGMFLHIDVVDTELLRDAQEHPEKYPNLSVRIAGWSARFATLNKEWQDMIINRTQQRA